MRTYRDKGRRGNASRAALVQFFSLFFRLIFSLVFNILSLSFPIRRFIRVYLFSSSPWVVCFRDIIQILCFSFLSRPVRERVQSEKLAEVFGFIVSILYQFYPSKKLPELVRVDKSSTAASNWTSTTTKKKCEKQFQMRKVSFGVSVFL